MATILVVDDSSTVRDEVAGFLKKTGWMLRRRRTARTGWPRSRATKPSGW